MAETSTPWKEEGLKDRLAKTTLRGFVTSSMPYKIVGKCKWYTHLTPGEERAFWHEQRDEPGVGISAQSVKAVKEGKKVSIRVRTASKKLPHNPG